MDSVNGQFFRTEFTSAYNYLEMIIIKWVI